FRRVLFRSRGRTGRRPRRGHSRRRPAAASVLSSTPGVHSELRRVLTAASQDCECVRGSPQKTSTTHWKANMALPPIRSLVTSAALAAALVAPGTVGPGLIGTTVPAQAAPTDSQLGADG